MTGLGCAEVDCGFLIMRSKLAVGLHDGVTCSLSECSLYGKHTLSGTMTLTESKNVGMALSKLTARAILTANTGCDLHSTE